jgi:membrane protein insertase Oxa1/YidC/SpoIIIJ
MPCFVLVGLLPSVQKESKRARSHGRTPTLTQMRFLRCFHFFSFCGFPGCFLVFIFFVFRDFSFLSGFHFFAGWFTNPVLTT